MNVEYPYTTPIILTDDIFVDYGGQVANSTLVQRRAAYTIAEEMISEDIDTFLLPTIVTGSYHYRHRIMLDNTYIKRVFLTQFVDEKESIYYTVSGTANWEVARWNDEYGLLDIGSQVGSCHCNHGTLGYPYKVNVVYEAGLPTGTANHANILLALTTYANIILNEIVGYGNEAPGDIGIQYFSNQDYKESRKPLIRTVFGSSPKANFVHKLLTKWRKYRTGKL